MSNLYQVVPLEKKSVVYKAEMYRKNSDGTISRFEVSTTYRYGQGYLDSSVDSLPYKDDEVVTCNIETGFGCEFDDVIDCEFEFSEDLSEDEQATIRDSYSEGYQGWLYDGDHSWEFETSGLEILAPYQIMLVDASNGSVIQENVVLEDAPKYDPDAKLTWVFPTGAPK